MRLLPPWSRAPLLGLRQPAAVLAVLVTTAILACAVASAPLFLSSARSAALQQQLAPQCAEASWPEVGVGVGAPVGDRAAALAAAPQDAWAAEGRESVPALLVGSALGAGGNRQQGVPVAGADGAALSQPATLFWRPGALDHVEALGAAGGDGVWVPASYAQAAGVVAGGTLDVGGVPTPVAGTYTDLFDTVPDDYWCDLEDLFTNATSADTPPPALLLATDEQTLVDLAVAARGSLQSSAQVEVDGGTLTSSRAAALGAETDRAVARLPDIPPDDGGKGADPRLADAAGRAEVLESGLRGPVVPVAVAGGLLALVLVAAAGSFWADRRATEVRLLAARGVGPVPLAGKAALELGLPALAGAAVGWAASRLLVGGLGPAPELDPSATTAAVWAGVAAFAVGLVSAAAVAGLRARGTAERPLGAAPRWPARVPWELALLVAAGWCWVLLEGRDAVVSQAGVAQVNGLLVAFPLLAVAGAAVLLARLLTAALPRLRRWADRRRPPVFLAVNRLAAARAATATLLVAIALPVAVLGYTATLTASSRATLDAKVGVQLGAGAFAATATRVDPAAVTGGEGTTVLRFGDSTLTPAGGERTDVQTLAVDPATFAGTAFWAGSFADRSLTDLVADLTRETATVPVVAAGLPTGPYELRLGNVPVDVEVVATADVLPGRRTADPVVLVDRSRLPDVPPSAGSDQAVERWTNGDVGAAVAALQDAGAVRVVETVPADVQRTANFLGITWTFGYLSALAVFAGVIGAAGLLLYLEARSRSRVSGYVMARRLGLSRAAHLRSLLVELGGVAATGVLVGGVLAVGAVAAVYRRLDVDLLRPPTPLLHVPWPAVALTVVVALAVAGGAALYAQRSADRADPSSVLREDA
ncbi:FtsX-like permease family protein [Klenkia brasiliensis]|uniref:Putative ABC transport system permease protein n=1 Tax=Klenkia brasiliensis TaxID=333142 RepID=A0A1G7LYJ7_9ACTN|nr:FtsX-like permease family protein [Klenkia brasiliensis]SDF54592.1 putative ABC transport system permease protein [Klenkia brasiliensis]